MQNEKVNHLAEQYSAAGKFNALALFSKKQFEISAVEQLAPRSYYDRRKGLFWFSLALAFVCQVASAVSSYQFFASLTAVKLSGYYLIAATVAVLLLLEAAKYYLFNAFFADLFRLSGAKTDIGILIAATAISAVSIYASVAGGAALAIDTHAETAIETRFGSRQNAIKQEIAAIISRNTWKGSTWLSKSDRKLLEDKETLLKAEREAEQAAKMEAMQRNQSNANAYRYGFAAFEVLFIVTTLFVWYFRKKVAIESEVAHRKVIAERGSISQPQPVFTAEKPHKANPIGFQFGWQHQNTDTGAESNQEHENRVTKIVITEGTRICKHCGDAYQHKHHKQLYCSEPCRIAAWEQRTGKLFKKPRIKG